MDQQLQRQRAANDRLSPRPVVGAAGNPFAPEGDRLVKAATPPRRAMGTQAVPGGRRSGPPVRPDAGVAAKLPLIEISSRTGAPAPQADTASASLPAVATGVSPRRAIRGLRARTRTEARLASASALTPTGPRPVEQARGPATAPSWAAALHRSPAPLRSPFQTWSPARWCRADSGVSQQMESLGRGRSCRPSRRRESLRTRSGSRDLAGTASRAPRRSPPAPRCAHHQPLRTREARHNRQRARGERTSGAPAAQVRGLSLTRRPGARRPTRPVAGLGIARCSAETSGELLDDPA